jgi:hypothetical protein
MTSTAMEGLARAEVDRLLDLLAVDRADGAATAGIVERLLLCVDENEAEVPGLFVRQWSTSSGLTS